MKLSQVNKMICLQSVTSRKSFMIIYSCPLFLLCWSETPKTKTKDFHDKYEAATVTHI